MSSSDRRIEVRCRAALFVGLVGILCTPLLAWSSRRPELIVPEMRALAAWPDWRSTPLARWPGAFDAWLNDHFPLRTRVIQWHAIVRHRWLGEPSTLVTPGTDNWLFYNGEKTVRDLIGRERLSDIELGAWRLRLEGRWAWWRARGVDYLFVIAPNKSTIYPEKLPHYLRTQLRPGKLDQLLDYLRLHHCPVPILDLRPGLLAARHAQTVYWATDSHWNAEGLVVSCDAIALRLQQMGVPVRAREDAMRFRAEQVMREGDCISLLTLNGRWPLEPVTQLRLTFPSDARATETPLSTLPDWKSMAEWARPLAFERDSGVGRAVMLCDSFFRVGGLASEAHAQSPLLLNFRRFVSLWPWRGTSNTASYERLVEIAEMERPTVVIEQWTERYLRTLPLDHPEFQRARAAVLERQVTTDQPAQTSSSAGRSSNSFRAPR